MTAVAKNYPVLRFTARDVQHPTISHLVIHLQKRRQLRHFLLVPRIRFWIEDRFWLGTDAQESKSNHETESHNSWRFNWLWWLNKHSNSLFLYSLKSQSEGCLANVLSLVSKWWWFVIVQFHSKAILFSVFHCSTRKKSWAFCSLSAGWREDGDQSHTREWSHKKLFFPQ